MVMRLFTTTAANCVTILFIRESCWKHILVTGPLMNRPFHDVCFLIGSKALWISHNMVLLKTIPWPHFRKKRNYLSQIVMSLKKCCPAMIRVTLSNSWPQRLTLRTFLASSLGCHTIPMGVTSKVVFTKFVQKN